jgi:hypothetical protein
MLLTAAGIEFNRVGTLSQGQTPFSSDPVRRNLQSRSVLAVRSADSWKLGGHRSINVQLAQGPEIDNNLDRRDVAN